MCMGNKRAFLINPLDKNYTLKIHTSLHSYGILVWKIIVLKSFTRIFSKTIDIKDG